MNQLTITNKNGDFIIFSNSAPYFLEKLGGALNVEMEVQKSPKQDGSTYFDNTLTSRALSIEGMMMAKGDAEAVFKARRKMQEVLNPKLGEVTVAYRDKEIKAVAESTPVFPGGSGSKGKYYQKYLIHLICHEPFWMEPFYESREMASFISLFEFPLILPTEFGTQGDVRLIKNAGQAQTPVKITFNGPAVNPEVINHTTGEMIRVKRELLAGDKLEISTAFGKKHVRINGENAFHWIDLDSVFWQLQVGENKIQYRADDGQDEATVIIQWKNRFIGV